jgi:eukaryotic-like serine/threonine-protein kinase
MRMKFNPKLTAAEVQNAFGPLFTSVEALPDGEGGQGIVFKVFQPKNAIPGAVKIYYPGSVTERTQREVDALLRIKCDTLVTLRDSGQIAVRGDSCMFVITDFIDGSVLSGSLTGKPCDAKTVARIGHDIALAIDAIWAERIVHRDIKPDNIMLTKAGRAVMIDLGVARHLSLGSLTTVGKTWGTEGYLSPEQARTQRQLSCKSDIFSLGVVLQQCLLGKHPTGRNQLLLLGGGIASKRLGITIPPEFEQVLDAMLSRQPHLRPNPKDIAPALLKHA